MGKGEAHSQCFLNRLVVGSQEQGCVGAVEITSPGYLVEPSLFLAILIIFDRAQVLLQLTVLS